jgi:hypothetical protein
MLRSVDCGVRCDCDARHERVIASEPSAIVTAGSRKQMKLERAKWGRGPWGHCQLTVIRRVRRDGNFRPVRTADCHITLRSRASV